jgi:SsrA-binding protein
MNKKSPPSQVKSNDKAESGYKVLASNRKARFSYEILETYEAGLVLLGCEIKSIRRGNVTVGESYIRPFSDGLYLVSANIGAFSESAGIYRDYDPLRPRKLLLHKREIVNLKKAVSQKGLTLVPLDLHLVRGYAKLKMALAKGKLNPDKRDAIKAREQKRTLDRAVKYSQ